MSTPSHFLGVSQSLSGKAWRQRATDDQLAAEHARRLKAPDLVGRLLAGRGVQPDEAQLFLNPTLKDLFPDPSTFADMDKAAEVILDAIVAGKKVAVFADYDVDGGTSSAILARYFRAWGRELILYVPDRLTEGFGPTPGAFRALQGMGAELVVTVDCGAAAIAALQTANEIGLDVVVMDHHLMHDDHTPPTLALVNPNRPDDTSGHGFLAAAGVVFVLVVALNRLARARGVQPAGGLPDPMKWLDLAALGTLCDMAPLKGVNRAIVTRGLGVLERLENAGLKALAEVSGIEAPKSVYHATFVLGPRLNAGGRIGDPWTAAKLLATDDRAEAIQLAEKLNFQNAERKEVEAGIQKAAMEQVERRLAEKPDAAILVVGGEGWHPGVIGIVAGRLKEKYHRPAIVVGWGEGLGPVARGSGRSVAGVNLGELVSGAAKSGLLLSGGGHAMAAGLTLDATRLDEFAREFDAEVLRWQAGGSLADRLETDGELGSEDFSLATAEALREGGPWGQAFPEPTFDQVFRVHKARVLSDTHLKLWVEPEGSNRRFDAIAFNLLQGRPNLLGSDGAPALGERVHLVYRLDVNEWNGERRLQLLVDHLLE